MSVRQTRKTTIYRCDYPGCKARCVAPYTLFKLAWPYAKAAGWKSATLDGLKFLHFCSWVHRPANDRQLQEVIDGKRPGEVIYTAGAS